MLGNISRCPSKSSSIFILSFVTATTVRPPKLPKSLILIFIASLNSLNKTSLKLNPSRVGPEEIFATLKFVPPAKVGDIYRIFI
jgi:hypothetical protein